MHASTAPPGPGTLSRQTFEKVRKLVYEKAGIDLRDGKESLVAARLSRLLGRGHGRSYEECVDRASKDPTGESLIALIDALTTNYTYFLREPRHFEFMTSEILPALGSRNKIDIWCAAAATGEEPYSLAFTCLEHLGPVAQQRCSILATDISVQALAQAREGVYPEERFQSVPRDWWSKYLLRGHGKSHGYLKIKPSVAGMVQFARLNLVDPFDPGRQFPLISCRNVLIYFDRPTQSRIVHRLSMFLEPGGYLFVGLSESLNGIEHPLEYVRPAIYRKPDPRSQGQNAVTSVRGGRS